jgi:hypothetical protein
MGTLLRARGVQQQLTWALMRPTVGPVLMAGGGESHARRVPVVLRGPPLVRRA